MWFYLLRFQFKRGTLIKYFSWQLLDILLTFEGRANGFLQCAHGLTSSLAGLCCPYPQQHSDFSQNFQLKNVQVNWEQKHILSHPRGFKEPLNSERQRSSDSNCRAHWGWTWGTLCEITWVDIFFSKCPWWFFFEISEVFVFCHKWQMNHRNCFWQPHWDARPQASPSLAGINWHLPGASELRSHNFYLSSKYCGPHAWG